MIGSFQVRGKVRCHTAAVDIFLLTHVYSTYNSAARVCVLFDMKANITLKLDAALLREAKILAAEDGTSISAMLSGRLEQMVRERKTYERARRRAMARLREGMNLQ